MADPLLRRDGAPRAERAATSADASRSSLWTPDRCGRFCSLRSGLPALTPPGFDRRPRNCRLRSTRPGTCVCGYSRSPPTPVRRRTAGRHDARAAAFADTGYRAVQMRGFTAFRSGLTFSDFRRRRRPFYRLIALVPNSYRAPNRLSRAGGRVPAARIIGRLTVARADFSEGGDPRFRPRELSASDDCPVLTLGAN